MTAVDRRFHCTCGRGFTSAVGAGVHAGKQTSAGHPGHYWAYDPVRDAPCTHVWVEPGLGGTLECCDCDARLWSDGSWR